jgi:hypothetical protein
VAATDRLLAEKPELAGAVTRAIGKAHAALKGDLGVATQIGRKLFPACRPG